MKIYVLLILSIFLIGGCIPQTEQKVYTESCYNIFKLTGDYSGLPYGFLGKDNINVGSRANEEVELIDFGKGYFGIVYGCDITLAKKMVFIDMSWNEFLSITNFKEYTSSIIKEPFEEFYLCRYSEEEIKDFIENNGLTKCGRVI